MTEQQIRDAFIPYKHSYYGVVGLYPSVNQGPNDWSNDNYHLFNALYEQVLNSWGYYLNFKEISDSVDFGNACEKQSGLYARFPSRMNDDISQDEIYGICFSCKFNSFINIYVL